MKTYLLVLVSIFLPVIAFAQKLSQDKSLIIWMSQSSVLLSLKKGHLMEPLLIWMVILI